LKVKTNRIQLFPKFEDFDSVNNGYVSQNQFHRVLNELNLSSLLNSNELDNIMKRFSVKIGTRNDVNYLKFCDNIHNMASFEYRKP
jgi:Ca2+-binding EF-hand superfamily protein